jgi:hypothetical protein
MKDGKSTNILTFLLQNSSEAYEIWDGIIRIIRLLTSLLDFWCYCIALKNTFISKAAIFRDVTLCVLVKVYGPIRWRHEDSLRRWDNSIRLHGGSLYSRAFFIVLNLKTSNFTQIRPLGLNHQIFQKLWQKLLRGGEQSRDWSVMLLGLLCLQERQF